MHRTAVVALWLAAPAALAQGIYLPSVVHGTAPRPAVTRPAVPLQPAAPPGGVTSIAPSVVLGWGGQAPSFGSPVPGVAVPWQSYPGVVAPVQPYPGFGVPSYPHAGYPVQVVPAPVLPYVPYVPGPPGGTLHRWSTP